MHLDPNDDSDSPHPTQFPTPDPHPQTQPLAANPEATINITMGMWESVFARIAKQDATIELLTMNYHILNQSHASLEREHYELVNSRPKLGNSEPKIADPPMFKGDRAKLLPFLTKCQLKFEGQPSQFGNDRAKVLYAGTRLEGTPFSWFQPLIKSWPVGTPSELGPAEICTWEAFQESLTSIYGDPNLAATADREIHALKQTGSVAEYAAKFESHKQYLGWNDPAFRDVFYRGLDKDIKNIMAAFGKPVTYKLLKELAVRLDSRFEERRLEVRQEQGRASYPSTISRLTPRFHSPAPHTKITPAPAPAPTTTTSASTSTPTSASTSLRVPSHSADGTVPMELDSSGVWRLAASERERRHRLGLCSYCAAKDHSMDRCPVRPHHPSRPRLDRRAFMSVEVSTDAPEKGFTQE